MSKKNKKQPKPINVTLKEKLAERILFLEDLEAQERFAIDFGEKKEIIQQQINVNHQIQALRTVIRMFAKE